MHHFIVNISSSFLSPIRGADVKVPWLCAGRRGSSQTTSKESKMETVVQFTAVLCKRFSTLKLMFVSRDCINTLATAACVALLLIQNNPV